MFIDSHCHFNFDCFDENRSALIAQLAGINIQKLMIPGTDAKRWSEIIDLAYQNNNIYFSLGIHPHFLGSFEEQHLSLLKKLLTLESKKLDCKCVALGEIGLDKSLDLNMALQEDAFLAQLEIAQSLQLPVILHIVKTQSRVLQLLKQVKFSNGGIYHAFSGSEEVANEFIKLGFKLGIGGVITYPNATKTRSTVSKLPLSSLVLETDAPDMPVYQQSSANNSPANLLVVYNALCKLRKESAKLVEQHLYLNTKSILSITHD